MPARSRLLTALLFAWLALPALASAGMPTVSISDVHQLRLQTIGFFAAVFLLCALGLKFIWNSLRGDFPKLPRLSYAKALLLLTLWGLVFVLVLTMISGARELLTPGAWEKQGLTYKLAE